MSQKMSNFAYDNPQLWQVGTRFPLLQPVNAWRCLQRWITLNHELSKQLTELGYSPRQRIFTLALVGAIVYYLGEP